MSHQIITKMTYNASTRHIETWQHSNNVWPRTDHFYAMDVGTDEKMFQFIKLIAERSWQGRKWRRQFEILFKEYPELRMDNEQIGHFRHSDVPSFSNWRAGGKSGPGIYRENQDRKSVV